MEECAVLEPGLSIKPRVNPGEVEKILNKTFGLNCLSSKQLNGYDDNNYHVKVASQYDNAFIDKICEDGYTLKIVNLLDSKKPQIVEAQNRLLLHLGGRGICCPKPVMTKNGEFYVASSFDSGKHVVRLLEFISGSILYQITPSFNLFYQAGEYVAKLDEALKDFHHSAYDTYTSLWLLESVPKLSEFLYAVENDGRKRMVAQIVDQFTKKVLPVSQNLERGMIHGDFNEQNILVEQRNGEWFIKGILDFGDSQFSCYLYELAIAMTYMMLQGKSIDVGGHFLAGYSSVRKLPAEEYALLKVCIAARLCQSLVMGAYSSLQDPNNSYILVTAKPGWSLLEQLWPQPEALLIEQWRSVAQKT